MSSHTLNFILIAKLNHSSDLTRIKKERIK